MQEPLNTLTVLTEREAANTLHLSVKTLQNWRTLCKGPQYSRVGRRILYRPEDLSRFLDRCAVKPILKN